MDPDVTETVRAFYDFSIEGDCWHCLSCCFVIEGASQSSDPVSWHHCDTFFQLLLDSVDWCVGVTGGSKHQAGAIAVQSIWCRHCRLVTWESLVDVPMGREDLFSKSRGDLSFLKCCCEPSCLSPADAMYCTRSSISSLNCTLLHASYRSTATASVCSFP